jgi:hypothetical protein
VTHQLGMKTSQPRLLRKWRTRTENCEPPAKELKEMCQITDDDNKLNKKDEFDWSQSLNLPTKTLTLSSGWQNSHNFEVWKNFPTPFLCKWHYNGLSSVWASKETYTFSNELLCTKKFSFYSNYLLDIFYCFDTQITHQITYLCLLQCFSTHPF